MIETKKLTTIMEDILFAIPSKFSSSPANSLKVSKNRVKNLAKN